MTSPSGRKRLLALVAVVGGVALLATTAATLPRTTPTPPASAPIAETALSRAISTAQARLRATPDDPATWARLGSAYVEQARVTADPSYYGKAQGALEKSLALRPENGQALIGLGALANARHDFTAARDWGSRAAVVLPDTAEAQGVLADAHTQLGDADAATAAVQRMLDLEPGVPSFTRASYDLELHGRTDEARQALDRALQDATGPGDVAFCRYYLGELAFGSGDLDLADEHYDLGLLADPRDVPLAQGKAKTAAARGRTDDALAAYRDITRRVPLPQYLQEYAVLLRDAGRADEADRQWDLVARQEELLAAAGSVDHLTSSQTAAERGDAAAALAHAEAEWARRPNTLVADTLAWALHLNGRDAEALGFADRAAALGKRDAVFAFHRGTVLAALGRDADAVAALEDSLRINPRSPVAAPASTALAGLRGRR
ncbi:tetratricopeptide repeat protein [Umezawaea endophytica]|uniref:Tetratricopeptide repeat protein n=1 Tax=Umezawaea endophytica TaxID=1654476 RepID=A0A9X3AFR1_9PSEU|nr:tetratricopeptide repeat protein [Umezawaea endophytica]MCS7478636.1 tetratricopeptide repeat protein [Umezawaea endophytica]